MSGRMSRAKGRRAEYDVRDYFRGLGYGANRVPLSGASQGFKGDVEIDIRGEKLYAEVKSRADEFKHIYAFADSKRGSTKFKYADTCIALSYDFNSLGFTGGSAILFFEPTGDFLKGHERAVRKLLGLRKYVKDCDFLVLKIDRKPLLFARYI